MSLFNFFTSQFSHAHYCIVFIPRTETRLVSCILVPCIALSYLLICRQHSGSSSVEAHFCCTYVKAIIPSHMQWFPTAMPGELLCVATR